MAPSQRHDAAGRTYVELAAYIRDLWSDVGSSGSARAERPIPVTTTDEADLPEELAERLR